MSALGQWRTFAKLYDQKKKDRLAAVSPNSISRSDQAAAFLRRLRPRMPSPTSAVPNRSAAGGSGTCVTEVNARALLMFKFVADCPAEMSLNPVSAENTSRISFLPPEPPTCMAKMLARPVKSVPRGISPFGTVFTGETPKIPATRATCGKALKPQRHSSHGACTAQFSLAGLATEFRE